MRRFKTGRSAAPAGGPWSRSVRSSVVAMPGSGGWHSQHLQRGLVASDHQCGDRQQLHQQPGGGASPPAQAGGR
jgi:hypothetical protein